MADSFRDLSPLDHLINVIDQGLRASSGQASAALGSGRPMPRAATDQRPAPLAPAVALASARLMRVNHAGEVAAQALYHGQALTARDPANRDFLLQAAREEGDHLAWCAERLGELHSRSSLLSPFWYAGSVAIGALAGLAGDRISLGFIAETERQVENHLDGHLARLPPEDADSRAILEQMKTDEISHGRAALKRGGGDLPGPVTALMRLTSRLMTASAYWI